MLRLSNNRIFLWQWDANQMLVVEREDVTEVHFRDLSGEAAMVLDVIEQDGKRVAKIPNVLLTEAKPIDAYAYRIAGDMATLEHITIEVKARQKPADYVYTETEVKRWETLEERIKALEQSGGGITQETDPTVPEWAKQPKKPTYTAAEVGALPVGTPIPPAYILPPATADTLGGVKVGNGLTVDQTGLLGVKPGPEYELIESITVEQPISSVKRTSEPNGIRYNFKAIFIRIDAKPNTTSCAVNIGTNDWKHAASIPNGITTAANTYSNASIWIENGIIRYEASAGTTDRYGVSNKIGASYERALIKANIIYSIDIMPAGNNNVTAGTKIEIWGVRA